MGSKGFSWLSVRGVAVFFFFSCKDEPENQIVSRVTYAFWSHDPPPQRDPIDLNCTHKTQDRMSQASSWPSIRLRSPWSSWDYYSVLIRNKIMDHLSDKRSQALRVKTFGVLRILAEYPADFCSLILPMTMFKV